MKNSKWPLSVVSVKSIQSSLTATAIFGIMGTSSLVSYATMIFSGVCPDYFGTGLALFLLAGFVSVFLISQFSSHEGVIANIHDVPSTVCGLIAVSLATMLSSQNQDVIFANLFVAIALSSALTGICFILLGRFKLGNMVRFIPDPVVGGFLAGTAWLLFKYGLNVSTGVGFNLVDIVTFFEQVDAAKLICCITFGLSIMWLRGRFPTNIFIMPATIVGSILVFWLVATVLGFSFDVVAEQGWLLGPMPEGALWQSLSFPDLGLVEWPTLLKQFMSISTIIILSVINFLLNENGVEFAVGKDLDVNRDLYVTGTTNVVNSFLGAPVSYIYVSSTILANNIGANYRIVGALTGCIYLSVLIAGGTLLSCFPKFVAGGLLFYLGLSMLKEWLIDTRKSIPMIDYSVILGIIIIVEFFGFLQGIALGIIVSVVIFVFRYSSINIIKNIFDGSNVKSSKDRSIPDQRLLDYNVDQLITLQLQGFIFFGTASSLYEKVKSLVSDLDGSLQFVLMDFKLVQGIDSSAVKCFQKLALYLSKENIGLVMVNLSKQMRFTFEVSGISSQSYQHLYDYNNLDEAIEFCEDQIVKIESQKIIQSQEKGSSGQTELIQAVYSDMMAALEIQEKFEVLTDKLKPYLERVEVSVGDELYHQKELSTDIYFVIRGMVTLSRKDRTDRSSRIRILGPWTITGELGSLLGYRSPYTAEVTEKGFVYKLSSKNRIRMKDDSPEMASELQELIIFTLGNQLMKNSRLINNTTN